MLIVKRGVFVSVPLVLKVKVKVKVKLKCLCAQAPYFDSTVYAISSLYIKLHVL